MAEKAFYQKLGKYIAPGVSKSLIMQFLPDNIPRASIYLSYSETPNFLSR